MELGLKEEDFDLFDGEFVRFEYDESKGVRLYDPYYRTSYGEYIDVDGWSAWSSEKDTFMSRILEKGIDTGKEGKSPDDWAAEALQRRFGKKPETEK